MTLKEQIQEGQNLSNQALKVIMEGLDKLKKEGIAIATFKETFDADYAKLMKEKTK